MNAEDYIKLKREVEGLQQRKDRIKGALSELLRSLKRDYQCQNFKEAESLLLNVEQEEERLESIMDKRLKKFLTKYGEKI